MSRFVKIQSDYSPETYMMITISDDGDVAIKICGNGEMRITTCGGHFHGTDLCMVIKAFENVIKAIEKARRESEMPDRETVIKAVEYLNWYFTQDDGTADKNAVKAWEVLLREQEAMKPKKGVWLHPTSLDCCCSECGRQPEHEPGEAVPLYPYCPDCGAKMEVKWN